MFWVCFAFVKVGYDIVHIKNLYHLLTLSQHPNGFFLVCYLWLNVSTLLFQVDFWRPNSISLISRNTTADIHVKCNDTQGLHKRLTQSKIDYR